MKNVAMSLKGTVLTIVVDLAQKNGTSKSGKSTLIASSGGNVTIPGSSAKIGLNVYEGV
jgi:hypothetical protein